ncbi:MAG: dienelactone hydrolase family protein [Chromatiales bacterium]|nr:dienelactone hydrolase family protein [Chromatiales bacterium]
MYTGLSLRLASGLLASLAAAVVWAQQPAVSADDRATLARTAEAHAHDTPVATPAATTAPRVPVTGAEVVYATVGGKPVTGFLTRPQGSGKEKLPALIVIHEWWGLNDNVRDEAKRLAGEGYVVLAVDLYQGATADAPPAAMKLSRGLTENPGPAEDNLKQAYAYLTKELKAPRIGTIGWCLGGRWSFRTALLFPEEVDAAVIYYGSVKADDAEVARLKMPVLGLFGGKDRVVPMPMVDAFREQAARLGRDVTIQVYPEADHAFANPSGTAYDAPAAEDAWARTTAFLEANLKR